MSRDVNSLKNDRGDLLEAIPEPHWPEAGNDHVEGANSPDATGTRRERLSYAQSKIAHSPT